MSVSDTDFFFCASRNLPTIISWVEAQRPGVDGVNIITSDFVELTDFANIVIKLNNLLLSDQDRKSRWHRFSQRDEGALTHGEPAALRLADRASVLSKKEIKIHIGSQWARHKAFKTSRNSSANIHLYFWLW